MAKRDKGIVTPTQTPHTKEELMAMAFKFMGGNDTELSSKQIDKVLELREKGMDYTHVERTKFLPHNILELVTVFLILLFILALLALVMWRAPEYTSQTISAIIGLFGGGGIGYGYGNYKNSKKE